MRICGAGWVSVNNSIRPCESGGCHACLRVYQSGQRAGQGFHGRAEDAGTSDAANQTTRKHVVQIIRARSAQASAYNSGWDVQVPFCIGIMLGFRKRGQLFES